MPQFLPRRVDCIGKIHPTWFTCTLQLSKSPIRWRSASVRWGSQHMSWHPIWLALHQICIHQCEKRICAAVEYHPVHVSQDFEGRRFEGRLADSSSNWLGYGVGCALCDGVGIQTVCRRSTAFELGDDKGGQEA